MSTKLHSSSAGRTVRSKYHIRNVDLHKYFPGDDYLAAGIARLCVLREDFVFELQGYVESHDVPLEDEYGSAWRMLYFFRRMCVTLAEIGTACEDLSRRKEFKRLLAAQSELLNLDWKSLKAALQKAKGIITHVRHATSAHILQKYVEQALREMGCAERGGILQVSSKRAVETHFKFTGELITAILFSGVDPANQEKEAKDRADRFLPAVENLLETIDNLFYGYMKQRGLL